MYSKESVQQLVKDQQELKQLKEDTKEAVNTMWRFINSYEGNNSVPQGLALHSAKFHLGKLDYLFNEEEK